MSKQQKLIKQLKTKPTPSDFKWNDLVKVLNGLGFKKLNGGGSRRKFYNEGKDVLIILHEPHPQNEVDKGALVSVVDTLTQSGMI